MRLLLDTHIWIWCAASPKHIGRRTARLLASPGNELWLSPISVWEFLQLARTGRFPRIRDPYAWVSGALTGWPYREAASTWQIAREAGDFEMPHGDPADRFIVATARLMQCTLVTQDEAIIASELVATIPND